MTDLVQQVLQNYIPSRELGLKIEFDNGHLKNEKILKEILDRNPPFLVGYFKKSNVSIKFLSPSDFYSITSILSSPSFQQTTTNESRETQKHDLEDHIY